MRKIAAWIMVLVVMIALGGIKVQAAEEEVTETALEAAGTGEEARNPKGLQEMWQIVKDSVTKVRATKETIEKAEKDLAKATKKKDVELCHKALKDEQGRFKKEVDALCTAIDEFSQWIEPQEIEEPEPEVEEGIEMEIEEPEEGTEVEPGAELEWLDKE